MKILSLDLLAWGPFTGNSLCFAAGAEGLHVIYGPNEAGKSSALRALRALLYGMEERTQDNFLHEHSRLRIGACLRRSDGTAIEFVRRKGRSKTLLNPDGSAAEDRLLEPFLGSVSEALFTRFFGISHADLVAGGRDILTGKGGVGESLFAAAMGGGTLRRLLESLDDESGEIYRPRGSRQALNAALDRHRDLRKRVSELSVPGREWEEHDRRLSELRERRAAALAETEKARSELSRIERLEKALPLAVSREELRRQRLEMGDVLLLPEGFAERRRQAESGLRMAQEKHGRAEARIRQILIDLEGLRIPRELLIEENRVAGLYRLSGMQQKAAKDLPKRIAELQQAEADARAILTELRPDLPFEQAETLRIGLAAKSRLRELASNYAALSARQASAERAIGVVDERLSKAREELQGLGSPRDPRPLKSLLRRLQEQADPARARAEVAAQIESAMARARVELQQLPLWQGSLENLEALAIPTDETIRRMESAFAAAQKGLESIKAQLRERNDRCARLTRDIESLKAESELPTEAGLEEARARREAGWRLVRAAWLEGRPDESAARAYDAGLPLDRAYERSVARADEIADRMRREAGRVAQNATWLADRERTLAESAAAGEEQARAAAHLENLQAEWRDLWQPAGIKPLPPPEMREWVQLRRGLLEQAKSIRSSALELSALESRVRGNRDEMAAALAALGESEPGARESYGALLDRCRRVGDRVETAERRRAELLRSFEELDSERAENRREAREATEALSRWRDDWAAAVASIGFGAELTPATVNAVLDRLDNLFEKAGSVNGLRRRIEKMEADAAAFAAQTSALVTEVAPDLSESPTDQAAEEMHQRLTRAREDRVRQAELQKRLVAETDTRSEAEQNIARWEHAIGELCRIAQCGDSGQIEAIEARSDLARRFDAESEALSRQLAQHVSGGTVDDLVREAQQADRDTLAAEKPRLFGEVQRLEAEISGLDQGIGRETSELARVDGRSAAAEAAEEAQAALAEVRALTERWLELRAATALLRAGIECYRARNQGALLGRVGELFAALTCGSFAGLQTQYDENDHPVLAGVRPDGKQVLVEGMSDGTCDQLYLALRLASIERHLESNESVPLVLDDVLVHFDDERSQATLRVLAELSRRTQVLLFTHHAHLVELARALLQEDVLFVHSLAGAAPRTGSAGVTEPG